jgi:FAD synthetase
MDVNQGWPDNLRFLPLIDWTYKDIWNFINENEIDVCGLYY